jgi:hypothetical protein
MTDVPETITTLFGGQPEGIRGRLLGCWTPAHYRIQDVLALLRLADLEPRLMFVRAPRALAATEGVIVESFDSSDPEIAEAYRDDLTAAAARWRAGPRAERSRLLGEFTNLVFQALDSISNEWAPRVGLPCLVDDYLVIPVLLFRRSGLFRALDALENASVPRTPGPAMNLILLVIEGALTEVSRALRDREMGTFDLTLRDPVEVLRRAGRDLMALVTRGFPGGEGAYETCNAVSVLPYEHRRCAGEVVLATREDLRLEDVVLFRTPVAFRQQDARAVRKLLEATSPRAALLCDTRVVFGLGRERAVEGRPALRRVVFEDHGVWSVRLGLNIVMNIREGVPGLPWTRVDEGQFAAGVRALDPASIQESVERLVGLVRAAATLRHGVLIVLCRDPEAAVQRLGPQCMAVEPFVLTADRVGELSSVDGAVVLGLDARCHAFGAILDGLAAQAEDRARGSRFNSAVRYVTQNAGSVVAVVVSSDGMVDVLGPGQAGGAQDGQEGAEEGQGEEGQDEAGQGASPDEGGA